MGLSDISITFVPDPTKVRACPKCSGKKVVAGSVKWSRGKDSLEVEVSQCKGCGEEFLPIYRFLDWEYFVNGKQKP